MEKHLYGMVCHLLHKHVPIVPHTIFVVNLSLIFSFCVCLAGVNWALIRCTSPPEVPRPFELGIPVSNSASPAEDVSASKGAKVASQDTPLSSSSSSTLSSSGHKLMSESRKTTGEKQGSSNNTRAAPIESSHSSGGSYVDFDFF